MAEPGSGIVVGAIAGVIALGIGIALFRQKPATTSSPKAGLPELPTLTPEEASTAASFAPSALTPEEAAAVPVPTPAQAAAPTPAAPPLYISYTYQPPPSQSKPVYRAGE